MTELRDEIRAILRQELSLILAETSNASVETVRMETSKDLQDFAVSILDRMEDPSFAIRIREGRLRFVLDSPSTASGPQIPQTAAAVLVPSPQAAREVPLLDRKLVTETDIAELPAGTVRIPETARITPLARDEASRRGVRIERVKS